MSTFKPLSSQHALPHITDLFAKRWFLLLAGNFKEGKYNAMTVSWGMVGIMWGKQVALVMSRPQRFTGEFLHKYPDFTLCSLPEGYKKGLTLCGSVSGRKIPTKLNDAGFTPIAVEGLDSPAIAEAELIIGCKILYKDDLEAENLNKETLAQWYPQNDLHTLFIGEIKVLLEKSN